MARTKKSMLVKKKKPQGKTRNIVSIKTKLEIIRLHDAGWTNAALSQKFGYSKSTVATIYSDASKLKFKKSNT